MNKRKKFKRSIVWKIAIAVFAAVMIFKPISLQIQIHDLQAQADSLDEQITEQENINNDLKESLDEGITGESIAKIAREVLGYVSPGERVYVDSTEK